MQRAADQITQDWADGGCDCCGRKLNPKTMVWLERSFKTNRMYEPGTCPADESQGCFAFGAACARKTLRNQQR